MTKWQSPIANSVV